MEKYLDGDLPATNSPKSNVEIGNRLTKIIPQLRSAQKYQNRYDKMVTVVSTEVNFRLVTPVVKHVRSTTMLTENTKNKERKPVIPKIKFVFFSLIRYIYGLENPAYVVTQKIKPMGSIY
jgi:hypothetical protein